MGVDEAPVLGRRAPVVEGEGGSESGAIVAIYPIAAAAVEILDGFRKSVYRMSEKASQSHVKVAGRVNDLVSRLRQLPNRS